MQCRISNNDMLLSTSWETWYAHQNTPLLLIYSESPLNDTSKGNARNWTPHTSLGWSRMMMKFWYMVCFLWKGQDTLFSLDNWSPQDNRSPSPTCSSHRVLMGLPFKNLALFCPRLKPSSMGSARCFHIKADWYLLTLSSQLCQLSLCVVSFCLPKSLSKLTGIGNIVCGVKVISTKKRFLFGRLGAYLQAQN